MCPRSCQTSLFTGFSSVILTSATLTVQGGFEHIAKRLGLVGARELTVPSHFDYSEAGAALPAALHARPARSRLSCRRPRNACDACWNCRAAAPSASSPATRRCGPCMSACSLSCRFLCCCRARRRAKQLLDEFRDTPNAVLFGTSSLLAGCGRAGRPA